MSNKILIIKTGSTIDSLLAKGEDFEDWFIAASGWPASEFHLCSIHLDEPLPELSGLDGIIITGSAAYLSDLAPWNYIGADYLRRAHEQAIPLLGICYGHQLLAWAFDGDVGFHPGGREIGSVTINLTTAAESDPLLAGLGSRFMAQVSHQQSVLRLPEAAVRLAENDFEPNHGFRLGDSTWGFQFHPEFSTEVMRAYIAARAQTIAAEGIEPDDLLDRVQPTPQSTALIERFVRLAKVK
jgi:GMP synthase (glutamine-hydrolysing)